MTQNETLALGLFFAATYIAVCLAVRIWKQRAEQARTWSLIASVRNGVCK